MATKKPKPTPDQTAVQLGALLGQSFSNYNDFYNSNTLQQGRFLGQLIKKIHPDLQAKLTAAENALNGQGYVSQPGSIYKIGGGDPLSGGHRWGLAVDINYDSNPYIMHESGEAELDAQLFGVYERIVWLITGVTYGSVIPTKITQGVPAGFSSVTDAYTQLMQESQDMVQYFALMDNDANLAALCQQRTANATDWKSRIQSDYVTLGGTLPGVTAPSIPAGQDRPFVLKGGASAAKRDPKKGFLDIPQPVVEALTAQGLIWGAIGFGPESGDVMHFDLRSGTFYTQVQQAWNNAQAALG